MKPAATAQTSPPTTWITLLAASSLAVAGAAMWVVPADVQAFIGLPTADIPANLYMRQVGAWQLVATFCLLAGAQGASPAASTALISSAVAVLASIPINEYFERSKPEAIQGVLIFSSLGMLTATRRLGPRVAAGLVSFLGLLIHLTPVDTATLYSIAPDMASPLLYSMISAMGATTFLSGLYVGCLAAGLVQARALALTMLANAAFATKFAFIDAEALGAPKTVPLAWSVVHVLIAALALK